MISVAKESKAYLIPTGIATLLLFLFGFATAGSVGLLTLAFFLFFFRDPERQVPPGEGLILAPADGKVVRVSPPGGEAGGSLVSIFLSLWDVHVNRSPVSGTVSTVTYRKGSFHLAFRDKASERNEQNVIAFQHPLGSVTIRQIAGALARRVVCWVRAGERVDAGQRIGLIKFGSRVDLIVPAQSEIKVKVGEKVKGGMTIIGVLR